MRNIRFWEIKFGGGAGYVIRIIIANESGTLLKLYQYQFRGRQIKEQVSDFKLISLKNATSYGNSNFLSSIQKITSL